MLVTYLSSFFLPNLGLTTPLPGHITKMPVGQMPIGGATVSGPEH